MPNWCYNRLEVRGPTQAIHEVFDPAIASQEDFFNVIKPRPADEEDNWYEWNISNWGTKWDANPEQVDIDDDNDGMSTVSTNFDSAWSPPIGVAEHLHELGFEVRLYYYEPGIGFAGVWEDGSDDCYELSELSSDEMEEQLPDDLNEMFGISEERRMWEEENQDEFVEWYEDGVEEKKLKPHDPDEIFNNKPKESK